LINKLLDSTQCEEFEFDLELFSGVVPFEFFKIARFEVLELIVEHLRGDSVTVVTISESLKDERSLGGLLFKSDTKANTFGERLKSESSSLSVPIATSGSIDHWVGVRETSSGDVSFLVEFDLTRVSNGHDAVIADWNLDLDWIDRSLFSVGWFEGSIGSDGQIPFEPSGESVGFGQPDSMHKVGHPLLVLITTFVIFDSWVFIVKGIELEFLDHWVVELV